MPTEQQIEELAGRLFARTKECVPYRILDKTNLKELLIIAVNMTKDEDAEIARQRVSYSMPISCPDNLPGCLVYHAVPATREASGEEASKAILSSKIKET